MNRRFRGFARATWCAALVGMVACGADVTGSTESAAREIPMPGTCEAAAMLTAVNDATLQQLDVDMELDRRAAENIVAAQPIATLPELDAVRYVGVSALTKILTYAEEQGLLAACAASPLPEPGSCAAGAMLQVANQASVEELDNDAALNSRAAENIVAARPINSLTELDDVSYVGNSALTKILAYAEAQGLVAACEASSNELGIVSDLDKTVVPPAEPDLSAPPYPGVATLYQILEHRNDGQAGDMHYVTARPPEMVEEIPAYLDDHDVPAGPIETGVSGLPWVAELEKISDVSAILDATGSQKFVLFGDSSHRDPEVYKQIRSLYPERIIAAFIHKVNITVSPHRVEGLHLTNDYTEVAALLYGYEVLTRAEAKEVMEAAQSEGVSITNAQIEALLDQHAP